MVAVLGNFVVTGIEGCNVSAQPIDLLLRQLTETDFEASDGLAIGLKDQVSQGLV